VVLPVPPLSDRTAIVSAMPLEPYRGLYSVMAAGWAELGTATVSRKYRA